jgi:small GTP-binding protein
MQEVKCVVVGDGLIGKTCMVVSYTTNAFVDQNTASCESHFANIMVDNTPVRLEIVDFVRQDGYDQLRPTYYSQANVFLLCYSIVLPNSFNNVKTKWYPEIRKHCPTAPCILIGTQLDLREDQTTIEKLAEMNLTPITNQQSSQLAKDIGAVNFLECSAFTQAGLKDVFQEATKVALATLKAPASNQTCSLL